MWTLGQGEGCYFAPLRLGSLFMRVHLSHTLSSKSYILVFVKDTLSKESGYIKISIWAHALVVLTKVCFQPKSHFFMPLLAQRHPIDQPYWQQKQLSSWTALWVSSLFCISAASRLYQGSRCPGGSRFSSSSGLTKITGPHAAQEVVFYIPIWARPPKMGIMRSGFGYFRISHVVLYLE